MKSKTWIICLMLSATSISIHAQKAMGARQAATGDAVFTATADLSKCTTIDTSLSEQCYKLLDEWMRAHDGLQGQIAVLEAGTGQLQAWVALEKTKQEMRQAPLNRRFCSSEAFQPFVATECLALSHTSLEDTVHTGSGIYQVDEKTILRDHNWRMGGYGILTYREALLFRSIIGIHRAIMTMPDGMRYWNKAIDKTKNTNAMEMAATFNSMYHLDALTVPTLESDNVCTQAINMDATQRSYLKDIAVGNFKEHGIQHKSAPKDVELAGVYHLANDSTEQTFSFIGCFPAEQPRYAISMVVVKKRNGASSPIMLSDAINPLIEWLNKR